MSQPTQTKHPWRATLRTVVAATIAFLPLLPEILDALGISGLPIVAGIITVMGGITRVLAMPRFNAWLTAYVPWLGAAPGKDVRPDP